MNCQSFKNQIDEAAFTAELNRHLEACSDCKTFREERDCLRRLLGELKHVNAPSNFEFGVRAKLNSTPAFSTGNRVWVRRFAFASPVLAVATVSAFVFSNLNAPSPTNVETGASVVQNANVVAAPIATPIASPTQQILAATNANILTTEPVVNKPVANTAVVGEQLAQRNAAARKANRGAVKPKDEIFSRTSDEPKATSDEALTTAPRILPDGISENPQKKIRAGEALPFFGVEIDENGSVKTVRSKTAAAANGIQAGDVIESINGRKPADANLDTPLQQITIEISRGGSKRKVTMNIKSN